MTALARIVCAVALAPAVATADPEPRAGWTIEPLLGTDFPIDVGGGVMVEAPFRVRASTTIGILPGPYVDTINTSLVALGAYSQDVANVISATLSSSLVWRTHVGYRPFRCHGFYAMVGYGYVGLGGGATAAELIEAATGKQLPTPDRAQPREVAVHSTLDMVDVEVGWEWRLPHRIEVRAALGGAFTFAASTTITPDYTPANPAATQAFNNAAAAYLDNEYTSYVFTPVITVNAGYLF